MRTIAIMQPTFLPWIGYFAMIDRVDAFVFLDSVQFAKRSWQQRNQIKTTNGGQWITMPVDSSGKRDQLIKDTLIAKDGDPKKKLINAITSNYGKAPYFKKYSEALFQEILESDGNLCSLNIAMIRLLMRHLGMDEGKLSRSSEMPVSGNKTDLLVDICKHLKFERYLSAPGSKDYIEESEAFAKAGIQVAYHEYKHPEYKQLYGDFVPYMSVIDLLFNEGENSLNILRNG